MCILMLDLWFYIFCPKRTHLSGLCDDVDLEVCDALEADLLVAVEDLEGLGDGGAVDDARGERHHVGGGIGGRV